MEECVDEEPCVSPCTLQTQKDRTQEDMVQEVRVQILQLLNTVLSESSIVMLQEKLQLMQRASFYLEIVRVDPPLPAEYQQQQGRRLSDMEILARINAQRLRRATTLILSHIKFLISFLQMLYHEIIRSCQELKVFIEKFDQGLVNEDMAASTRSTLRHTEKCIIDFQDRTSQTSVPVDLQVKLMPNVGYYPIPKLAIHLSIKLPVIFDRSQLLIETNLVVLSWKESGEQPPDPNQWFEVYIKTSDPENGQQFLKTTCQSYRIHITNLIPDRFYEFSVMRVNRGILAYCSWIDTINLKTLDVPKSQ